MLRTQLVLRLIRSNRSYRPISTAPIDFTAQNVNKNRLNVDEVFNKDRRAIEPLTEDPIIVKNLFVGHVDKEQMLYPEVISKDELDRVYKINDDVTEFIDSHVQFDDKGISQSTDESLKQKGMYGYNVPREFGGHEHTYTETMLASEAESRNANVAMVLNSHRLVCEAINEYGTGEQRAKYLPPLATGDLIATTAFQEWNRDDIAANRSNAIYNGDKRQWILNGTKSFVVNAAKSNLFLVTALVPQSSKTDSLSVFIVDGNLPGVSVHKRDDTVGLRNVYQSSVSFKDVCLSEDALLSLPGSGRHIEKTTQFLSRIQQGALNLTQMKEVSNYMLNMVDPVEQHKRITSPESGDFMANTLRVEVSKSASNTYAAESLLYMTAGLMDLYKNTNIDVESAIVKTFSQDALLSMAMSLSGVIDSPATVDEHPINHIIRDAVQLQTFGEPKDILKLHIGVAGIQFSGDYVAEEVIKKRNPLFNPEYMIRQFWREEKMDKYESNLQLLESVVKEFDTQAHWLEASIKRLQLGTKNLMLHYGRKLLNQHRDIQRLAEAATYNYASFACLVRANRSWILKLPGCEQERVLAGCCGDMYHRLVKDLMIITEHGPIVADQRNYQLIAKQMLKTKSYFPVHPVSRFF